MKIKFIRQYRSKNGTPVFDVNESRIRGVTYAAPLRIKLRLVLLEEGSTADNQIIKDIREQDVYMGEMPLMTTTGSFVINGTERVVVSQLHLYYVYIVLVLIL